MSSGKNKAASHLASFGLIAGGLVVCASFGAGIAKDSELKAPLNPFGINTSPYGEVLAMAMQEPVDVYWNHASDSGTRHVAHATPPSGFRNKARHFIEEMEAAAVERTNPHHTGRTHAFFLRREIEKKLRFAYELDPGHYGNYNSYHFFLTEPAVGTHRELNNESLQLAGRTIHYCLSRSDDPRLALTAAAAAENVLMLMFNDSRNTEPRFTTAQMREQLSLLDHCLTRYDEISAEWDKTGNWSLLSEQRLLECRDRFNFILQMRGTAEKTIRRLESVDKSPTSSHPAESTSSKS